MANSSLNESPRPSALRASHLNGNWGSGSLKYPPPTLAWAPMNHLCSVRSIGRCAAPVAP
jgi:hypothetical protein